MHTHVRHHIPQQVRGLLWLAWGLSPLALVAAILLCALSLAGDIHRLVLVPVQGLGRAWAEVRQSALDAGETLSRALDPLAGVQQRVADALQAVEHLPTQVAVPALHIPDAALPVKPDVQLHKGYVRSTCNFSHHVNSYDG